MCKYRFRLRSVNKGGAMKGGEGIGEEDGGRHKAGQEGGMENKEEEQRRGTH